MTAWAPGQWVQASNGDEQWWDSAAWQVGKAPALATGANAGMPGFFTPDGCQTPGNQLLLTLTANPGDEWQTGEHVTSFQGVDFHWDGAAWQIDEAP